ncbi:hypothetical protein ACH419_32540 [Streptomyces bobili]|uniref:hypothetical protein n=1 Tax=Streptomyces bobili TaxID=67280 RepID=UPI0037A08863
MSAELERRVGEGSHRDVVRADESGTSRSALQRFFRGARVPTRDIVQHLLDIAEQERQEPPSPEQIHQLWTSYRAALHETFGLLARFYDAVDDRDAALRKTIDLQQASAAQEAGLQRAQRRAQVSGLLHHHVQERLERAERALRGERTGRRHAQADRARLLAERRQLTAERDQLKAEAALLHEEARSLRDSLAKGLARGASNDRGAAAAAEQMLQEERQHIEQLLCAATESLDRGESSTEAPSAADRTQLQQLEQQHAAALRTVDQLGAQLLATSRDLADARTELVRRDGDLARLIEQHAQEIAPYGDTTILAPANYGPHVHPVRLDPLTPVACADEGDVPALGSIHFPSSRQPDDAAPSRTSTNGPHGGAAALPASGVRLSGEIPAGGAPKDAVTQPSAGDCPDRTASEARGGRAGRPIRLSYRSPGWQLRLALVIGAGLLLVGATGAGLWWSLGNEDPLVHGRASPETTPTLTPSTAGLPPQPAPDPEADIGDQPVNTAAIMKLPKCPHPSFVFGSVSDTYYYQDPHVSLTLMANGSPDWAPCRIDVSPSRLYMTVAPTDKEATVWKPPVWRSSFCTKGRTAQRWLQLTQAKNVTVDFHWNRRETGEDCATSTSAASGTYAARLYMLDSDYDETSFVLAPIICPGPVQHAQCL